jgi:hypothetical protein
MGPLRRSTANIERERAGWTNCGHPVAPQCVPLRLEGPRTSPAAIGFLVYSLTRNDIPGPGLIERWYVGTVRSIGNVRSQKSEAGLHGKLPLRAT